MNVNIIIGFLVAVLSIIFGFYFDGGSFASLYSPTSILIVLGGASSEDDGELPTGDA
jgi:flagellar motor component MotA